MTGSETSDSMLPIRMAVHGSEKRAVMQWLPHEHPARILIKLALAIFVSEMLVMIALSFLPSFSVIVEALVDSALLILLLSPMLYFSLFRPLTSDIAERRRTQRELARQAEELKISNAELEQFAYVASHDLQEPLRMVSSYLQLLEHRYSGKLDNEANDFIQFAIDGATRMQRLTSDLLTYSRVGTHQREFGPVCCEDVLDQVLSNLQVAVEEESAVIIRDPLPVVVANGGQLPQLFQNLIGNGLKFHGDEPPRIYISAEENANEWVFSVRDDGIGIDPEHREDIFQIFQRLHSREQYPGTGIGLATCKKIVQNHGGRIWVEAGFDKGANFYFTIPKTDLE